MWAPPFWAGAVEPRRWRLPAPGAVSRRDAEKQGRRRGCAPCCVCCALATFAPSRQEAKPQRRVAPFFSPPRGEGQGVGAPRGGRKAIHRTPNPHPHPFPLWKGPMVNPPQERPVLSRTKEEPPAGGRAGALDPKKIEFIAFFSIAVPLFEGGGLWSRSRLETSTRSRSFRRLDGRHLEPRCGVQCRVCRMHQLLRHADGSASRSHEPSQISRHYPQKRRSIRMDRQGELRRGQPFRAA